MAQGLFAPSPLAGEGWDGGEKCGIGTPPAVTPTLALPRRGGGDGTLEPQQDGMLNTLTLPEKRCVRSYTPCSSCWRVAAAATMSSQSHHCGIVLTSAHRAAWSA